MKPVLSFSTESGSKYCVYEGCGKEYIIRSSENSLRKDNEYVELMGYDIEVGKCALLYLEPLSDSADITLRQTTKIKKIKYF